MNFRLLVVFIVIFDFHLTIASNYEIILEKVEPALGDDEKVIKFHTLRIKKFNRTLYVANGKYTLLRPLTDSMVFSATALNFQGGTYKKIADKDVEKPITALYNNTKYREYFENFQRHHLYPVPWNTNPYPAGDNELINLVIEDYASVLPDYLPGGEKWKFEVRYLENDELLGGANIYGKLRNQRSLLEGGK